MHCYNVHEFLSDSCLAIASSASQHVSLITRWMVCPVHRISFIYSFILLQQSSDIFSRIHANLPQPIQFHYVIANELYSHSHSDHIPIVNKQQPPTIYRQRGERPTTVPVLANIRYRSRSWMDPYKEYIAQTSYAHSAVYYIHGVAVYRSSTTYRIRVV